jgi:hypothetical protein
MLVTKNENIGTTTLTLDGHDLAVLKQAIAHAAMHYMSLLVNKRYCVEGQKEDWEAKRNELNNMSAALGGNKY